ncbi:MAG: metal ABC transporter substrate-binding protein [Nocardioides sp.]
MKRTLVTRSLAAVVGVTCLLAGCGEEGDVSTAKDRPAVVAAFYPLAYVAQRVAGTHATVRNLTTPGGEAHDLTLGVKQTTEVISADLVVYQSEFQPSVDDSVPQNTNGVVLDVAEILTLEPFEEHESEGKTDGANSDEEHEEHGSFDPHFWQDPLRMAELGDRVADELSDIDPPHAAAYAANAANLRTDMAALDQAYVDGLGSCARNTVVVSHDAFGYLAKYGLVLEPIAGLSPDAEPTPADLARLRDLIASEGITTVFSETLVSPALSETLAREADVGSEVLDPIEGLSDTTADEDYLSLMKGNLLALQQANGC